MWNLWRESGDTSHDGIYKAKDINDHRVISTGTAFLISHILSDNNARIDAFGPRSYLNIPGKTIHKVLIAAEGADQALINRHYFDTIITLSDLFQGEY